MLFTDGADTRCGQRCVAASSALTEFTFRGDVDDSEPIAMETSMTEANFGSQKLGVSGAIIVAAFVPKCQ